MAEESDEERLERLRRLQQACDVENTPHIDGFQVWERDTDLGGGDTFNESLGLPDSTESITLDRAFLEQLLVKAGYEFKGIAKGGHTCWHEQVEAGDA